MRVLISLSREAGLYVARVSWLDPDGTARRFVLACNTRAGALAEVDEMLERQGIT